MKKILIILGSYFPNPSANGICVKQVAEEFKARGVDVSVLATQTKGLSEHEIIDDVNIYRIKSRWIHRLFELSEGYKQNNIKWIFQKLLLFLNKIKNILFFPTWPLISPIYTYRYYKKANELHKQYKYDGILSVYTPIDSLIAGALIKKKHTDMKFMLYFLDTLSGGIPPKGFNREWLENRGYKWEKKLFNIADSIFVMKSHEQNYSKAIYNKFKSKIQVVDIPLMRRIKISTGINEINFNKRKVNIVYTGSLLKHIRNPSYMFKIFSRITNDFLFHIFGGGDCSDLIDDYIIDNKGIKIIKHGFVRYETANNAIMHSDILINIGNINGNLIPSKIFEYMATGKPIISFYKYEKEPSILYLKKYPLSLLIKEDIELIDENTKRIVDFINENNNMSVEYNKVENIFKNNTAERTVDEMLKEI